MKNEKYRGLQIVFHFANHVIAGEKKNDSSYLMPLTEIFIRFMYPVLSDYFLNTQITDQTPFIAGRILI